MERHRTACIAGAVDAWLANEGGLLGQSVERTVAEGLFPRHDVTFMLEEIRRTVTGKTLIQWVDTAVSRTGIKAEASPGQTRKVLCLHAGNLPMVGLQDLLAVLLSGGAYYGKLTRKDPRLMDGLLRLLQERLPDQVISWSTNMDDLAGIRADNVLFAGSEGSVDAVTRRCRELGLSREYTRFLYRTARFSMALLSSADFNDAGDLAPDVAGSLAEAILRYDGKGCRSVAVVIAPVTLTEAASGLQSALMDFLQQNPSESQQHPSIRYWSAYLKSVKRAVVRTGPALVTDEPDMAGMERVVCWIHHPEPVAQAETLASRYGHRLQQVYVTADTLKEHIRKPVSDGGLRLAPLEEAQRPPIAWQPDGVDVLQWLLAE
ncbi:acyl-CoA reductase [Balneolales bacterium ANBcel1]|nr:acyl-CoA reductase [Balneolales bacterium ANBcel1]